jgi:protein gp37
MRMAARFAENGWSKGLINLKTGKWNGEARLAVHKLREPLGWREPSTVFVNSMSDLFYEGFSDQEIAAVFGVMAATPRHTYLILTKRPDRMRTWFDWVAVQTTGLRTIPFAPRLVCRVEADKVINPKTQGRPLGTESDPRGWPLPNVWLGVSTEDQDAYVDRVRDLHFVPAAIHFISAEPLLGAIDMSADSINPAWLDWVIDGCESGPGARPAEDAWFDSIAAQCRAAGVPLFHKQQMVDGELVHDFPGRQDFPSAR